MLNDEVMPTVGSSRQMDIFLPLPLGADAVNRRGEEIFNPGSKPVALSS